MKGGGKEIKVSEQNMKKINAQFWKLNIYRISRKRKKERSRLLKT